MITLKIKITPMGFNKHYNLIPPNMKTSKMKVAFCGASGTGKSTMARRIAQYCNLPYTENSAGLLLPEKDQDFLISHYGWKKNGHKGVIQLTNNNPDFGWEFQTRLLSARSKFIYEKEAFVIDRSPVDNITYFLLQNSHLYEQGKCEAFIRAALVAAEPLTHIIFLKPLNFVEDNGSRVANLVYQDMVTSVFEYVLFKYFAGDNRVLTLDTSDLYLRESLITSFLRG